MQVFIDICAGLNNFTKDLKSYIGSMTSTEKDKREEMAKLRGREQKNKHLFIFPVDQPTQPRAAL